MIEALLRCQLLPGVFSNEWGVRFAAVEDEVAASFVSRRDVQALREPDDGEPGEGLLHVYRVREHDGRVLVLLPRETISGKSKVWVSESSLQQP